MGVGPHATRRWWVRLIAIIFWAVTMACMKEKYQPYDPKDLPSPCSRSARSEIEFNSTIQESASKCMGEPDPFSCAEACAIALIADEWSASNAPQS